MEKDKSLNFKTYEEAAVWFDTHDMADYVDLMQPVDFSFDLRKNRDWVELENDIARNVRELAKRQKIPDGMPPGPGPGRGRDCPPLLFGLTLVSPDNTI